jgi:hypothetical protein
MDRETLDNYADFCGPVVVCDSSAILFKDRLFELWPKARWVLVVRAENDVQESLKRLFPHNEDPMPVLKQFMDGFVSSDRETFSIGYEHLNSPDTMGALWKYAAPNVPFDPGRFKRLCAMRIEAMDYSSPMEVSSDCGGSPKIRRIA